MVSERATNFECLGIFKGFVNLPNFSLDLRFTIEHPFLTKDGWKSVQPDKGTEYGNLVVGDEINIETDWIVIESIDEYDGDFNQPVYNFTVETLNSYIANGIVVHNK